MRLINPSHLLGATRHSLAGLVHAFTSEQAFRHEVLILVVLVLVLAFGGHGSGTWLLVIGGWLLVMMVELLNSAIEEAFDLVSTDWHPRIKAGKDMASAAIFLALVLNVGLWVHVFILN